MSVTSIKEASGLLSTKQVAARWNVHPNTVRSYVKKGVIPGTTEAMQYYRVGRNIRFSLEQVEYIEQRMIRLKRRRSGAAA